MQIQTSLGKVAWCPEECQPGLQTSQNPEFNSLTLQSQHGESWRYQNDDPELALKQKLFSAGLQLHSRFIPAGAGSRLVSLLSTNPLAAHMGKVMFRKTSSYLLKMEGQNIAKARGFERK